MEWRDIPGYEGLYQVSDAGLVRSLDRITTGNRDRKIRGKILKMSTTTTGYYKCELCKDGGKKSVKVHRLVAVAFIPNPDNCNVVNHKDMNPKNNKVQNLEWCTQSYNITHANKNGHKTGMEKKLSDEQMEEIIREYKPYSRTRGQKYFAEKFNVNQSTISHALSTMNL